MSLTLIELSDICKDAVKQVKTDIPVELEILYKGSKETLKPFTTMIDYQGSKTPGELGPPEKFVIISVVED